MNKHDDLKIQEEEIKLREEYIEQELKEIDEVLSKYMPHDDAIKITFHILNLMRAFTR